MPCMVFRFNWFTDWRKSVQNVLQNWYLKGTTEYKLSFSSLKSAKGFSFIFIFFIVELCFLYNAYEWILQLFRFDQCNSAIRISIPVPFLSRRMEIFKLHS